LIFVSSSLVLVAGLLLILLQTAAARGWIERALAREVKQRLALTMTVGGISGNVIRGIRLENFTLHDAQGRLVARADALSARYRPQCLARFHEVDEIAIERPVIERLPPAPATSQQGEPASFSVHRLIIRDGSLRDVQHLSASSAIHFGADGLQISTELHGPGFAARGHGNWRGGRLTASIESLDVDAAPLHAQATATGPLDALAVELHGHSDNRSLALGALVDVPHRTARLDAFVAAPARSARLQARAALRDGTLHLTAIEAHSGASRLSGVAHVDARGLDAALSARVAPADAAAIGIHPTAQIRLRTWLHGPTRELAVRVRGSQRAAQVELVGRVDLHARRGRARFVAYNVRPSQIERGAPGDLGFSGAFTFEGAIRDGLEGRMSVSDGRLLTRLGRFERLRGTSRVRLGGATGETYVEELSGQWRGRPIDVQTLIRWDRRELRFDAKRVVVNHNHAVGSVVYTSTLQPVLTIDARRLSLSPSLVQEFLHRRPQKPWSGNARVVWSPPSGYALTFALGTEGGPMKGAARIRSERGGLEVSSIAVAVGGSRLRGAARVKDGEIFASVDDLSLQPALVHGLWPALEPARALEVQGALAGPLHALDVDLIASAGGSTARFRGRVDWPARSFRLVGDIDNFYLKAIKQTGTSRINLELALVGRLVEGGVAGTLTVRHAWGTVEELPLEAGRLDAKLDGSRFHVEQVLIGVPGAVLDGKGGGSYRDFRVKYGVVITDALQLKKVPRELRLIVGLTTLFPGYSVVGSVRRRHGGKLEVTHHAIPPPFRIISVLAHLLTGRPLHLTVH
jgi:hypothetical protein